MITPADLPELPEAPAGVRIKRATGETFIPELVYRGVVEVGVHAGKHRWEMAGVKLQADDEVNVPQSEAADGAVIEVACQARRRLW